MCASLRVGLALAILGMGGRADAQPTPSQRDGQGAVTVVVTLAAPPQVGVPTRATVFLDTHTLALDGVVFERAVVLRTPRGWMSPLPGWKTRPAADTIVRRSSAFAR